MADAEGSPTAAVAEASARQAEVKQEAKGPAASGLPSPATEQENVIREGSHVIVYCGDSKKVCAVRADKNVKLGRLSFSLRGCIGKQYNSLFLIQKGQLEQIRHPPYEAAAADVVDVDGASGKDNRHLSDSAGNQLVSQSTIEQLRDSGVSGQELLDKLAKGSQTFASKTEFSQKKWLKKKTEKYLKTVRVARPTARLICDLQHERTPTQICFLRSDSLATLLLRANIRAGSRVLLLESAQGLLAGALLERMMGHGTIVQLHSGSQPPNSIVHLLDLPDSVKDMIVPFALNKVNDVRRRLATVATGGVDDYAPITLEEAYPDEAPGAQVLVDEARRARRRKRVANLNRANEELFRGEFDALVVVSRFHPLPVVTTLLPFLSKARPFAVYHNHKEPLLECYQAIRGAGAMNLKIVETFTREYQVLPRRTHPTMMTHAQSGFVFCGCTAFAGVRADEEEPGAAVDGEGGVPQKEPAPKRSKRSE